MSDFYRIANSQSTADRLKQLFAEAARTGRLDAAIRAARWIVGELERTPFEFGESRFELHGLRMQMRLASIEPLWVFFGVHEESRTVFVSQIELFRKKS